MLDSQILLEQLIEEGHSVSDIAEKLDCTQDSVYRWKRGDNIPCLNNMNRLKSLKKDQSMWSVVQVQGLSGTHSQVDIDVWKSVFANLAKAQVAVMEEIAEGLEKKLEDITLADFDVLSKDQVSGVVFSMKLGVESTDTVYVLTLIGTTNG